MPFASRATPTKPANTTSSEAPATSPRKVPHCRQCLRPRKGHPARGCPYVELLSSPTVSDAESEPEAPKASLKTTTNIINKLDVPLVPTKSKRVPLQAKGTGKNGTSWEPVVLPPPPRPLHEVQPTRTTRASSKKAMTTTTIDDKPEQRRAFPPVSFKVWQDFEPLTIPGPPKTPSQCKKPPPKSQGKVTSTSIPDPKLLSIPFLMQDTSDDISFRPKLASTPNPNNNRTAARSSFVAKLAEQAGASIHLIPASQSTALEKEAHELGLVTTSFSDGGSDETLLIVGRCQFAVDRFLQMAGIRRTPKPFGSRNSKGRTSV